MKKKLTKYSGPINGFIQITGSKSESNRLLILQQFYKNLKIENLGNSDDAQLMQKALSSSEIEVDINHAGTAMRFLTAYFSVAEGRETVLTGSKRMKERPIKILVDALRSLGAEIQYLGNDGFPPLKIKGKKITASKVVIDGGVSSQYVSALLLIAPSLDKGLTLEFQGKITSIPYIKMTLGLLSEIGVESNWIGNTIIVEPLLEISDRKITVESDWSSASYYYSLAALSLEANITLNSYKKSSLQGDAVLVEIYKHFGVKTVFQDDSITLIKESATCELTPLKLDLKDAPDIAQTIAVTCFGLGISCDLSGLHTLKIKETDRLVALKNEIEKLGGQVEITDESLHLKVSNSINENVLISTYHDHRMAMAFAPLFLKTTLFIEDSEVVSKSYPDYWNDIEKLIS